MGWWQGFSGWRRYRALDPAQRAIVFYAETGQDWHHFQPLIDELLGPLGRRVTYVTSDPSDPGLLHPGERYASVLIPEGFFLTLHFQVQKADLVVLTMMDLDQLHLKRSVNPVHYAYVFHSMGSTHMVDRANAYDAYDSLFCVGPHHVAELRRREELAGLAPRHLFEYGHPRLEALMREATEFTSSREDLASPPVLVAPTWGDDSIFNRCGKELIRPLLDAGLRVIMRPHYHTRRRTPEVVDALLAEFGGHPRFEYVDQMGENASLFRSGVLISDWSAMAIEYALGLEKPVVFIDLPRRVRNPDWKDWGIEPLEASIRREVGTVVSPRRLEEVPDAVDALLADREAFGERMRALRERAVFNLGSSVRKGAREIARLADLAASGGAAHG